MNWIALLLPLLAAVRDITELFQRDRGRAPTDDELIAAFSARQSVNEPWADVLARLRAAGGN